jgi:hypothetical protein
MAVTIGIDPHKRSHTAVAINGTSEVLGQVRVTADRRQVDRLIAFAASWPERVWAVENANGLGQLYRVSCWPRAKSSSTSPPSCPRGCGRSRARGTRPTALDDCTGSI